MGLKYKGCGVTDGWLNFNELRVFYGTENVVLGAVEGGPGGNRIKYSSEYSAGEDAAALFDGNPNSQWHSGEASGGEQHCSSH